MLSQEAILKMFECREDEAVEDYINSDLPDMEIVEKTHKRIAFRTGYQEGVKGCLQHLLRIKLSDLTGVK